MVKLRSPPIALRETISQTCCSFNTSKILRKLWRFERAEYLLDCSKTAFLWLIVKVNQNPKTSGQKLNSFRSFVQDVNGTGKRWLSRKYRFYLLEGLEKWLTLEYRNFRNKFQVFEMVDQKARQDCLKEIDLLKQLNHVNVIRCYIDLPLK